MWQTLTDTKFSKIEWQNIYKRNYKTQLKKFTEFKYEILMNILGCSVKINRWNPNVSKYCQVCGESENIPHLLSPTCIRRPWSGDYKTPSIHACVRACVHSSRFYINLNISFIYKHIFTKFAGNVYGYENLSLENFSLILTAIANSLKIINVL